MSDFDGTLCPTSSVKRNLFQKSIARIPHELEVSLLRISQQMPVFIISSKDFDFLHMATKRFASIISCVLGIETINHVKHSDDTILDCVIERHFNADIHALTENSKILSNILEQEKIQNYIHDHDICIERKFTSCNKTLIGITFDYKAAEILFRRIWLRRERLYIFRQLLGLEQVRWGDEYNMTGSLARKENNIMEDRLFSLI